MITLNAVTGITTPNVDGEVGNNTPAEGNFTVVNAPAMNVGGLALSPQTGFKNRIINGDMRIDQRNAGAAVTLNNSANLYPVDRLASYEESGGGMTAQQVTDAPPGFINCAKYTTTTASGALASTDRVLALQRIEGYNIADLGWGTANAQTVTLSFWAKSSLTGVFGGAFNNTDRTRSYPFTYTISAANTWQYFTVTALGDTSGTWLTNNGIGLQIVFGLGVGTTLSGTAGAWAGANYQSATGAVAVIQTLGATWQITGLQLEKGSTATPFEFRSYGQELALCQRYYYKVFPNLVDVALTGYGGGATSTTSSSMFGAFPVPMRIRPTALEQSGTAAHYAIRQPGLQNIACNAVPTYSSFTSNSSFFVSGTVASGLSANFPALISAANASAYLGWSAEL